VIATPEICKHTVGENEHFLILATDGVWEFIDNEQVRSALQWLRIWWCS
jgi:serine/threonine protein phosphatase PrpC